MAKTQITTAAEAASLVKDGMTVMVGGFMANGTPEPIIDELVKSNVKDLTIICNDAGFGRKKDKETGEWKGKARGVGKLVENGQVKKLIASVQNILKVRLILNLFRREPWQKESDAVDRDLAVFTHRRALVQKSLKEKK